MDLLHYGLKERPFQLNSDPRFLWPGPRQLKALNTLQYGAEENKGLLLMTGEVGTGKTTLISALEERIALRVVVARLPDPGLTRKEFFHFVADGFGIKARVQSKKAFVDHLGGLLTDVAENGRSSLLIVDEGQIMTPEILREVRLLSNLEVRNRKLLNILLVGQNELEQKLRRAENDALRERISLRCRLEPLQRRETEAYIVHRLETAGRSQPLFSPGAFDEIFEFTGGYPRQINILCDMALQAGWEGRAGTIDRQIVVQSEKRVRIPQGTAPAVLTSGPYPAPVLDSFRPSPAVEPGAGHRSAAMGIFLILVLVPSLFLLFGSSRQNRLLDEGRLWKTLISAPGFPNRPAAGRLSSGQGRTTQSRDSQPRPSRELPPESPATDAGRGASPPSASPPSVVIIEHRSPAPAKKERPTAAYGKTSAARSAVRPRKTHRPTLPKSAVEHSETAKTAPAPESPSNDTATAAPALPGPVSAVQNASAGLTPYERRADEGRRPQEFHESGEPQGAQRQTALRSAPLPEDRPMQSPAIPGITRPAAGTRAESVSPPPVAAETANPDPAAIFDWLLDSRRRRPQSSSLDR